MSRLIAYVIVTALLGSAAAEESLMTTWRDHGLGVDWFRDGRIAYDAKDANGVYQIHVVDAAGVDRVITAANPSLPHRHAATPEWHASGKFLAASVEKASHPGSSFDALPGFGAYNDVWAIAADGSRAWQLTNEPNDADHGVIVGGFSADGAHLTWAERWAAPNIFDGRRIFGYWRIKLADVSVAGDGTPSIANVRTLAPGGDAFYEPYGFSPDGMRLIFASPFNQPSVWSQQIFTMDAATGGDLRQLTSSDYNEHASYSRDGGTIVWMTNAGGSLGGTDWWLMDADGANKRRLTFMNLPGHPQCDGSARWAGRVAWSPDGSRFLGGGQYDLISQEGFIKLVQPLPDGTGTGLKGEYFANKTLTGVPALTRVDATVDFDWGWGPPANGMPVDDFAVRWTGDVEPHYGDTYTFTALSDDGVRLWVGGTLVIDGWTSHAAAESSGTIALAAGHRYPIRLEYYDDTLSASVRLSWSSAHQVKQVIPRTQLYPVSGSTSMLSGAGEATSGGSTGALAGAAAPTSGAAGCGLGGTAACAFGLLLLGRRRG
jgi:hypothetical protein